MSITNIPLEELTLQDVCNLLPNINFRILVTIAEEKEIDGSALDSVETLDDLVEVFPILPAVKLKALLTKITGFKADGVSPNLLLQQEVTGAVPVIVPVTVPVTIAAPHFAADGIRYMDYDDAEDSPLSLMCHPFSKIPISFINAMEPITNALTSGPIRELNIHNFGIVVEMAIAHGDYYTASNKDMSSDDASAIAIYTIESAFYTVLNEEMRSKARTNLTPFIKFIILLTRAIERCPIPIVNVVYRAFNNDVSTDYIKGKKFTWAQFSSTTTEIDKAEAFLSKCPAGTKGTLFIIDLSIKVGAKDIKGASTMPEECEIVFAPMSSFEVIGVINSDGFIIVQLRTIPSNRCLLKFVLLPSPPSLLSNPSASTSLLSGSSASSAPASASSTSASASTQLLLSSSASTPISWRCPACSFMNHGALCICEICGTNVPKASKADAGQLIPNIASVKRIKVCTFQSINDANGVICYIATKENTQSYCNPHKSGDVVASRSSNGVFGGGDVGNLVGNISEINTTANKKNSWMAVDLGARRSLVVNHFCLRFGWSSTSPTIHFIKNFELQGSNNGTNWDLIKRFEDDDFNHKAACPSPNNFGKDQPWAHWDIKAPNESYQQFRILQFGPNQGGGDVLALSGIELYGDLSEIIN